MGKNNSYIAKEPEGDFRCSLQMSEYEKVTRKMLNLLLSLTLSVLNNVGITGLTVPTAKKLGRTLPLQSQVPMVVAPMVVIIVVKIHT
jgi:hypothetical protein